MTAHMHAIGKKASQARLLLQEMLKDEQNRLPYRLDERRYTIEQAADKLGLPLENERTSARQRADRRKMLTLRDLNTMRREAQLQPRRPNGAATPIIAFYALKGGVGKTTLCVHGAHYFADRGYRVLLIDYDPQASASAYHGLDATAAVPEAEESTRYLLGETPQLRNAIRRTHIDQLDIIPANATLHQCDLQLALDLNTRTENSQKRMQAGLTTVSEGYDLVLIDSPPSLANLSLAILQNAKALLVPVRPSIVDCLSTADMLTMLSAWTARGGASHDDYDWIRLVFNGTTGHAGSAQHAIHETFGSLFGEYLLETSVPHSAEINASTLTMRSVYERPRAATDNRTRRRCINHLDRLYATIHTVVTDTWEATTNGTPTEPHA